jgi:hypothetical protein
LTDGWHIDGFPGVVSYGKELPSEDGDYWAFCKTAAAIGLRCTAYSCPLRATSCMTAQSQVWTRYASLKSYKGSAMLRNQTTRFTHGDTRLTEPPLKAGARSVAGLNRGRNRIG